MDPKPGTSRQAQELDPKPGTSRQALEQDFEDFIDVLANASSKDDDDNAVEILS